MQPNLRRPPRRRRERPIEIAACMGQDPLGVAYYVRGNSVREPQAPQLVSGQSLRPRTHRLDVVAGDAPMATHRREGQVTAVAEVDDMLPRGAEDYGGFAGRQQVVAFGFVE